MKGCLADVNVLLPLLVRHHEHGDLAPRWFEGLVPGEAVLCRFVQLALVRLLWNRPIMGKYAVSASAAWDLIAELIEDERLEFAAEPPSVDTVFPKLLRCTVPSNKLVGDAFPAVFSIAGQMRLTCDPQLSPLFSMLARTEKTPAKTPDGMPSGVTPGSIRRPPAARLTTVDKGFEQFRGLDLQLLCP